MSDDLNQVYNCEFTREELNIISNIFVVCYRRGAFQMSEIGYLQQVWDHIQVILGETKNASPEISPERRHEMPADAFDKKEESVTTVEEVADDMVEKLTTTVEKGETCNDCSCKGETCNDCSCKGEACKGKIFH